MLRVRESSYLLYSWRQGRPLPSSYCEGSFFNNKCVEMQMLLLKTVWLPFVVPCVPLFFYPANEFASVLVFSSYNLLAILSARKFTQHFKQILEHTNERQYLHLQNIFLKPKSRYHNHLSKVNFTCSRDFTDLRSAWIKWVRQDPSENNSSVNFQLFTSERM